MNENYKTPDFDTVVRELATPLWNAGYFRGGEIGMIQEQDRIIKLLAVFSHNFKELPMEQLIELIKGETNDN